LTGLRHIAVVRERLEHGGGARRARSPNQDLDPLRVGNEDLVDLDRVLEEPTVASHVHERLAFDGEPVDARCRGVHDAPALDLAAADLERRGELAVHEEEITLPTVLMVDLPLHGRRLGEVEGAVLQDAVVRENEEPLREALGQRVVWCADHEGPV
jgi:hypothetical protein